jgi:hypothetical protein
VKYKLMRGLEDTNRIQRLQMNNNSRDLKTHILKELIIFELWGKGETRGQVRAFALACPK